MRHISSRDQREINIDLEFTRQHGKSTLEVIERSVRRLRSGNCHYVPYRRIYDMPQLIAETMMSTEMVRSCRGKFYARPRRRYRHRHIYIFSREWEGESQSYTDYFRPCSFAVTVTV